MGNYYCEREVKSLLKIFEMTKTLCFFYKKILELLDYRKSLMNYSSIGTSPDVTTLTHWGSGTFL